MAKRTGLKTHVLQSKLHKGGYIGDYIGINIGDIKADARSLDNSLHRFIGPRYRDLQVFLFY